MVALFTDNVGEELTATFAIVDVEHPNEVPVTVQLVVSVGETAIDGDETPVLQEQVEAPVGIKVVVNPEHSVGELTEIIGKGLTDIVLTAVLVQPNALLPITV